MLEAHSSSSPIHLILVHLHHHQWAHLHLLLTELMGDTNLKDQSLQLLPYLSQLQDLVLLSLHVQLHHLKMDLYPLAKQVLISECLVITLFTCLQDHQWHHETLLHHPQEKKSLQPRKVTLLMRGVTFASY